MEQNSFCCVTTRGRENPPSSPATGTEGLSQQLGLSEGGAPAAPAPPPHALAEFPIGFAALVAAWRPASGVTTSGTPAPGSTAGSSAQGGKSVRTPCANKSAVGVLASWSHEAVGRYADLVPREVVAPAGAAREAVPSRSGIFFCHGRPGRSVPTDQLTLVKALPRSGTRLRPVNPPDDCHITPATHGKAKEMEKDTN
jgi:hypothetical protein